MTVLKMNSSQPCRHYETSNGVSFLINETWLTSDNRLHRLDGPAKRVWSIFGDPGSEHTVLVREKWYLNDILHRVDGVAHSEWEIHNNQSMLVYQGWYLNGLHHRVDGPAHTLWVEDEGVPFKVEEYWYLNGLSHRTDGPAGFFWDVNDKDNYYDFWYLKGENIKPRILRDPVRVIERWWKFQKARRLKAVEDILWDSGCIVFPGLMGIINEY